MFVAWFSYQVHAEEVMACCLSMFIIKKNQNHYVFLQRQILKIAHVAQYEYWFFKNENLWYIRRREMNEGKDWSIESWIGRASKRSMVQVRSLQARWQLPIINFLRKPLRKEYWMVLHLSLFSTVPLIICACWILMEMLCHNIYLKGFPLICLLQLKNFTFVQLKYIR